MMLRLPLFTEYLAVLVTDHRFKLPTNAASNYTQQTEVITVLYRDCATV